MLLPANHVRHPSPPSPSSFKTDWECSNYSTLRKCRVIRCALVRKCFSKLILCAVDVFYESDWPTKKFFFENWIAIKRWISSTFVLITDFFAVLRFHFYMEPIFWNLLCNLDFTQVLQTATPRLFFGCWCCSCCKHLGGGARLPLWRKKIADQARHFSTFVDFIVYEKR